MGLGIYVVCEITARAIAEVSGLKHDCESVRFEESRQLEQACELFAVSNGDVGIVALPSTCVVQSGLYFPQSFSSGRGELEGIFKS